MQICISFILSQKSISEESEYMEYNIDVSGTRVRLDVLANADPSLVGVQIGNCRIISMPENELAGIVIAAYGELIRYHYLRTLTKYRTLIPTDTKNGSIKPLVVIETKEGNGGEADVRQIVNLLKLYKATDVFSCYKAVYKFENQKLTRGGEVELIMPEHPLFWPDQPYQLCEEEREGLGQWYETYKGILQHSNHDKFKRIVRMYMDSFQTGEIETSFVILCVILEMLFGAQGGELNYRISRGAALFLSTSKDEMRSIQSQVKKLYTSRSKYVHEGKQIEPERLFEIREFIRKTIILMYERGMNEPEFDFKKFTEELTYGGYTT